MFEKRSFIGGLKLNLFAEEELEPIEGLTPAEQAPIIARNALRYLTMGGSSSWSKIITSDVLSAVFIQRDPELLREMRLAFQQGFLEIFNQLKDKKLNEDQKEQVQLYLSNCLCLLPFSDLTPYESIKVPQYIDGQWVHVEYTVKPIELTNISWPRRFFIQDHDRVFAYGLEPLLNKKAESHFIFMGTTYPAGQGFITQVNADFKGFETAGESLYRTGRVRIQKWHSQQQNAIHVCGTSLGGSLSLLLAIDCKPYNISRVDALNPAGLHSHNHYDSWDSNVSKPNVVVQKQENDPVSWFGFWKPDWEIVKVHPPQKANPFEAHCKSNAGLDETRFSYTTAEQDNSKRSLRNFWLYSLGRSLIYYGILVPYTYIFRPIGYFIVNTLNVLARICSLFLATNAQKNSPLSLRQDGEDVPLAKMHYPTLPRNPTMDIYNPDNAISLALTYQEVHTYYRIMRCFVKNKPFLPETGQGLKYIMGMSKRELLTNSMDPKRKEEEVTFNKVSKAKAAHIKRTLSLFANKELAREEMLDSYAEYRMGKRPVILNV